MDKRLNGNSSTLVTIEELESRCRKEGIDFLNVCVIAPRWAETAPKTEEAKSALVRCDLIIRSDGSAVALDGCLGVDSQMVASKHCRGEANPNNLTWDDYVKSLTSLPKK